MKNEQEIFDSFKKLKASGAASSFLNYNFQQLYLKRFSYKYLPEKKHNRIGKPLSNISFIKNFFFFPIKINFNGIPLVISINNKKLTFLNLLSLGNIFMSYDVFSLRDINNEIHAKCVIRKKKLFCENLFFGIVGCIFNLDSELEYMPPPRTTIDSFSMISLIKRKFLQTSWSSNISFKNNTLKINNLADPFVYYSSQDNLVIIGEDLNSDKGQIVKYRINKKNLTYKKQLFKTSWHSSFPVPTPNSNLIIETLALNRVSEWRLNENTLDEVKVILNGQFVDTICYGEDEYISTFLIDGVLETLIRYDAIKNTFSVLRSGCVGSRLGGRATKEYIPLQVNTYKYGAFLYIFNSINSPKPYAIIKNCHHYDKKNDAQVMDCLGSD